MKYTEKGPIYEKGDYIVLLFTSTQPTVLINDITDAQIYYQPFDKGSSGSCSKIDREMRPATIDEVLKYCDEHRFDIGDWITITKSKNNWRDEMNDHVGSTVKITEMVDKKRGWVHFYNDCGYQWVHECGHFRKATADEIKQATQIKLTKDMWVVISSTPGLGWNTKMNRYCNKVVQINDVWEDGFHIYQDPDDTSWTWAFKFSDVVRKATIEEIQKSRIIKPIVGAWYKLWNRRGDGWNMDGKMDRYKNRVVKVTNSSYYENKFEIEQDADDVREGNGKWSFRNEDIERIATPEEIEKAKVITPIVGSWYKLWNKKGKDWNWNGDMDRYINRVVRVTKINGKKFEIKLDDDDVRKNSEYPWTFNFEDIERLATRTEIQQAEDMYIGKHQVRITKDDVAVGCKHFTPQDVNTLYDLILKLEITEITAHGEKVSQRQVGRIVDKIDEHR